MSGMTRPSPWALATLSAAGLGLLTLAGCSRPFVSPLAEPPYRDRTPASYDATWRALIRALQRENVPLRAVAKDSGVIASDDFVSPIGLYADCGRLGDQRIEGEALVAFTVFVQPNSGNGTNIQINAKMRTEAYRRGSSGKLKSQPVYQCVSTGRFEANLGDSVRRLVEAGE
jgi:hypothetical protein